MSGGPSGGSGGQTSGPVGHTGLGTANPNADPSLPGGRFGNDPIGGWVSRNLGGKYTGFQSPKPGTVGGAPSWVTSGEYRDPRSPFYTGPPVRSLVSAGDKEEEKPVETAEKDPLYDDAAILAAQRRNLRMRRRPLLSQTPEDSTLGSSGVIFNRQDYGSTI
jgi:hypothetical protein